MISMERDAMSEDINEVMILILKWLMILILLEIDVMKYNDIQWWLYEILYNENSMYIVKYYS